MSMLSEKWSGSNMAFLWAWLHLAWSEIEIALEAITL